MFCGNCGAQVPDGSTVCPNCGAAMAPKAQAPNMNQGAQYQSPQFQNPQGGFPNQGVPAGNAPKKGNGKLIGIIAACVVVVALIIFCVVKFAGGSGPKGSYTDGSTVITFSGNKMTYYEMEMGMGMEMTVDYKIKKDKIEIDPESLEFSDQTIEYFEDFFGYDEDDIEDMIEEYVDDMEDETTVKFKYDKKKKVLKLDGDEYYYAENYKQGPSGKYTNDDDDDITFTFKDGKATFDNDGDDEEFEYYVYVDKKDKVHVLFYGEDFMESDFYDDYYSSSFEYNSKKDKFEIGGAEYKK